MTSRNIQDLDIELAHAFNETLAKWLEVYPTLPKPFLTCTYRPNAEQTELYASGRTKKGKILTNAKAGQSPHNYSPSMALDIAFKDSNGAVDWSEHLFKKFADLLSEITKQVVWGGSWQGFKDLPHFELKDWKHLVK